MGSHADTSLYCNQMIMNVQSTGSLLILYYNWIFSKFMEFILSGRQSEHCIRIRENVVIAAVMLSHHCLFRFGWILTLRRRFNMQQVHRVKCISTFNTPRHTWTDTGFKVPVAGFLPRDHWVSGGGEDNQSPAELNHTHPDTCRYQCRDQMMVTVV